MADIEYLGQNVDSILGRDFLTWLWYRCEFMPTEFRDAKGNDFLVYMEKRIVVQGGEGEAVETATVAGAHSLLREARLGLTTGKKVTRALVRFEWDGMSWQFSLRAEDFSLNSLRTPPIDKQDKDDDPDALFLEKMYLLEACLEKFDALYNNFLNLRLSSAWVGESKAVAEWIKSLD